MLTIRKANNTDRKIILDWRNDELTRKMFFNSKKIRLNEHFEWFEFNKKSENSFMFIIKRNNHKIAFVIFKKINNSSFFEISVNLNPKFRGLGLSSKVICKSIKFLNILNNKRINSIFANIKKNNINSIKAFLKSGFKFYSNSKEFDKYRYKY